MSRRRTLPWLRAKHKRAMKSKNLAFVQYKTNPSAYSFRVYREESNKLSKLMKKSRRKYEKQLALKLFFAHVRRNRHLKKNIIGLKVNEGETIFTPSAQAKVLKNFYSSIFREDYARPTPTLPVPTVVMPVPQFRLCIESSQVSISQKELVLITLTRRW